MPEQRKGRCVDCGEPHTLGTHCPMYHECCGLPVDGPHSATCGERPASLEELDAALRRVVKRLPSDACLCDERELPEQPSYHDIEQLHACSTPPTATQKQADAAIDRAVRRMLTNAKRRCCDTTPDQEHLTTCWAWNSQAAVFDAQLRYRDGRESSPSDSFTAAMNSLHATIDHLSMIYNAPVRADVVARTLNSVTVALSSLRNLIDVQATQPVCGPEMHTNVDPGRGWPL